MPPNAVLCKTCGGKFFAASLKFHMKACEIKQQSIEIPCPACDEMCRKDDLNFHMKRCPTRIRDLRRQKTSPQPTGGNVHRFKTMGQQKQKQKQQPSSNSNSKNYYDDTQQMSSSADESGRIQCSVCSRKFSADRIGVHQRICRKLNNRSTEVFNTTELRLKDLDIPTEKKSSSRRGKSLAPSRKPNSSSSNVDEDKQTKWRKQHEDFQKNIKEAKKIKRFMDNGGDVMDLPPVERDEADYADYVQCPHCLRNFNQKAGDRHIPKCANIIAKPKALPNAALIRRVGSTAPQLVRGAGGGARKGGV